MALQEFAQVEHSLNFSKAKLFKPVFIIKFKLIITMLSESKIYTNMWYSSRYCNPEIGVILVDGDKKTHKLVELKLEALI